MKTAWILRRVDLQNSGNVGRNLRTHAACRRAAKRLRQRYGIETYPAPMRVNSDCQLRK